MTNREKLLLGAIGCLVLVITILVVSGCDPISSPLQPHFTELGSESDSGTPEYPRLSDSLYRADTRSWVVPATGDSIWVSIDVARTCWIEVRRFDIQGIEFKEECTVVADSCRWLSGWYYKTNKPL